MIILNKALAHFKTIIKHRHMVIKHCKKAGILKQGLIHDLSKFSPTEFKPGAKYFQGNRSPNEGEREEYGYSLAWIHHKGRNKHHFEYWTDYNAETRVMEPVKMPINYVKEMFCDRVAASKIYMKEDYDSSCPLKYFMRSKGKRMIHPETSDFLEKLLIMLQDEGEDKVFEYLRNTNKY